MEIVRRFGKRPAMNRHWRLLSEQLPYNHPAWDLEATYIAYALVNEIMTLSPQRIVLGGGSWNAAAFPAHPPQGT